MQNHRDVKYILNFIACEIFHVQFISQKMLKTGLDMVNLTFFDV